MTSTLGRSRGEMPGIRSSCVAPRCQRGHGLHVAGKATASVHPSQVLTALSHERLRRAGVGSRLQGDIGSISDETTRSFQMFEKYPYLSIPQMRASLRIVLGCLFERISSSARLFGRSLFTRTVIPRLVGHCDGRRFRAGSDFTFRRHQP
jgi:hypothetical protein